MTIGSTSKSSDIKCIAEIKAIDSETDIFQLIPESDRPVAKKDPAPVNAFQQSLLSLSSLPIKPIDTDTCRPTTQKAENAFLKVFLKWEDELSDHYWNTYLSPTHFKPLKQSITGLLEQNKVDVLKQKLDQSGINSSLLHDRLTRLQQTLERIQSAHCVQVIQEKIRLLPSEISIPPNAIEKGLLLKRSKSTNNISSLAWNENREENDDRVLSDGEESFTDFEKNIQHQFLAKSILNQCPPSKEGWEQDLVDEFSSIDSQEGIQALAEQSEFQQIKTLIESILSSKEFYWKLGYLISGFDLKRLNTVIHELDKHQLLRINQIISDPTYTDAELMTSYFKRKTREWIRQCNKMKEKIDDLCDRLRFDVTGCSLSRRDLDRIKRYTSDVLRLEEISGKIEWLIKGVVTNLEWMHVSTNGIQKEYQNFRTRLTEKHEYEGRTSGCVWGIIYRMSFERLFSDSPEGYDEKDATETFADWVIINPDDYRIAGLLGDISDEAFNKLKQDKVRLNALAKHVLSKLGIEKIKHWKEKEIFNLSLFEEYLNRDEVRHVVNEALHKQLTCDLSQ